MLEEKTRWIPIGKIVRERGVSGELAVKSFNLNSKLALQGKCVGLEPPSTSALLQPKIEMIVTQAKVYRQGWCVKLQGITTPEEAKVFREYIVLVKREELPPLVEGEYYWSDLEGLTVLDLQGNVLGKIETMVNFGASDLCKITGKKITYLPWNPDFIVQVSLREGFVMVREDLLKELF